MKRFVSISVAGIFLKSMVLFFYLGGTLPCYAWDNHFLLTFVALSAAKNIDKTPNIAAETLNDFLVAESSGLVTLLARQEQWLREHMPDYPALPAVLAFDRRSSQRLVQIHFLEALRMNPAMTFPLFVQYPPSVLHPNMYHCASLKEVMLKELAATAETLHFPNLPLKKVASGELLSALEIVSTASDEPDYGMDMNLWEDNHSWFGKIYGFGQQSYGNKTVLFSSQVPFHMGFYHENKWLYLMAPYLKRTYVNYRIYQCLNISRYAFATGHLYWGYRFLGWSLHYAQDLTQPYHTTLSPNESLLQLIGTNALKLAGIEGPAQKLIQLLTNRHSSLENYEYFLLKHALENTQTAPFLLQALTDTKQDTVYPAYTHAYPIKIIAKESHALAATLDTLVRQTMPAVYIADANYLFYESDPAINMFQLLENVDTTNLDAEIAQLLKHLGAHTRILTTYVQTTSKKLLKDD